MRVLFINQTYHPDVAATAQHMHDLARHLAAHGHEPHVIASRAFYGQKGAVLPRRETIDGVHVHRVGRSLFGKAGIVARCMDFALFYVAAALKAFTVPRPDVVVCLTTPPFIALVGWLLGAVRGPRFVYWVMDLYPDLPVACGVMGPRAPHTRFFEAVNRFCLRRADKVVVLGRCMRQRVLDKGVPGEKVVHIGVWSDEQEVRPIARSENPYRASWGLGERFVAMYSGNFGLGHDVDTMLGAAERLRDDDRIRFVFVGGGKKKEAVDRFVAERRLPNSVVAPYQPRERLDASLSCADVHLVSLLEGVEGIMVPCKLFGAMAAARPSIFIGHPDSEIARVLVEHDCGVVVRQGDVEGLVGHIKRLAEDPAEAARMGGRARAALGAAYDRSRGCEAWRTLLEELAGRAGPAQAPTPRSAPSSGAPGGDARARTPAPR